MTTLATAPAATLPCRADPDLFGPTKPNTAATRQQIGEALALCGGCPVRVSCLEYAMTWNWRERAETVAGGVWFDTHGDPPGRQACRARYPQGGHATHRCTVRGPHDRHQLAPIKENS